MMLKITAVPDNAFFLRITAELCQVDPHTGISRPVAYSQTAIEATELRRYADVSQSLLASHQVQMLWAIADMLDKHNDPIDSVLFRSEWLGLDNRVLSANEGKRWTP